MGHSTRNYATIQHVRDLPVSSILCLSVHTLLAIDSRNRRRLHQPEILDLNLTQFPSHLAKPQMNIGGIACDVESNNVIKVGSFVCYSSFVLHRFHESSKAV